MSNLICLLVTVLYNGELLRCALKIHPNQLPPDFDPLFIEEERIAIHALLPLHVRECGPIVQIEQIFEVSDQT